MTGRAGEAKLTYRDLRLLRQAGLLDLTAFHRGLDAIRDDIFWRRWALRLLLSLAVAHLLAGILFFFAFNWADLPTMGKFAVIQGALVLCVLGALWRGLDSAGGQAFLVGANVMVLILFGAIGMVYQTGADAWQLFAAWTGLTVIWTLASRNVVAWLIWLGALCLSLGLLTGQLLEPRFGFGDDSEVVVPPILAVGIALAVWERGHRNGVNWLSVTWPRVLLLLVLLGLLYVVAMDHLFQSGADFPKPAEWAGSLPLLVVAGGLAWVNRTRAGDFRAVTGCVAGVALWLLSAGVRVGAEHYDSVGSWFLMTGWAVFVLWMTTRLLMRLHRAMEDRAMEETR